MSYQYSQEAKERISALGQATVVEFIEEIPQDLRRKVYDRLPKVQGFRPGTQVELKEKQKRLIGHLINPQASQTFDWQSFSLLWEAWARLHFGNTFPPGDNTLPTSEAGVTFLKNLATNFTGVAREDAERLFVFSCFPNHPDTAAILERFLPECALARDRLIDSLPKNLGEIESRLKKSESSVETLTHRIKEIENSSAALILSQESAIESNNKNAYAIAKLNADHDKTSSQVDSIERRIETHTTAISELSESILAREKQSNAIEQCVHNLASRGKEWDTLAKDVSSIQSTMAAFQEQTVDWAMTANALGILANRVTALEGILANGNIRATTNQRISPFERRVEGPFDEILSTDNACVMVVSNLLATGVARSTAITISRLIVSALVTGQLIQFTGSLADVIADAVAAAIGGPLFHEVRVPVGLISDGPISDCIKAVAESSSCLILKGANLSAFEVYGAPIRDVVVRRQFTTYCHGQLALIATWAQGPATFPDGGMLAELGPVFDTDTFAMKGVSTKLPQLVWGRLAKDSWEKIDRIESQTTAAEAEQLSSILNEAQFDGGALWKRIAHRAYTTLRSIHGEESERDLHSILYHWAVPWAKAKGVNTEDIIRIAARELADLQADTPY
ncbi:hypothetical protein [Paludibacterium sp. B53371]|uniref:hypothetical protein n=1 Tax=Paludibacterium sp. B53371 TaxID=2806263 RepID=UPI001C055481|nr:hypothetical protein [Paludibacterium sp. B53371]